MKSEERMEHVSALRDEENAHMMRDCELPSTSNRHHTMASDMVIRRDTDNNTNNNNSNSEDTMQRYERKQQNVVSLTRNEMKRIHCMIEQCLVRCCNREETIAVLSSVAGVDERISGILWDQLREQNLWFFRGYEVFLEQRHAMDEGSDTNMNRRKRKRVYSVSPG